MAFSDFSLAPVEATERSKTRTMFVPRAPGNEIVLLYHLWHGRGLTLRAVLPRDGAHIATLTDLIPGAALYEREVSEMLGVTFDNHPDPGTLLLPDNWDGEPPLRQQRGGVQ